jgi:hypothetical protein
LKLREGVDAQQMRKALDEGSDVRSDNTLKLSTNFSTASRSVYHGMRSVSRTDTTGNNAALIQLITDLRVNDVRERSIAALSSSTVNSLLKP